jgi:hypothetical protein
MLAALVAVLVYAGSSAWRVSLLGGDPSSFIVAGPPNTDPTTALPNLHVYPPGTTFDGQYFYRLALEPWTNAVAKYGVTLDEPAYRQERILYPLLAWVVSVGQWQLTPMALIVVNVAAAGLLGYASAAYAQTFGRSPLLFAAVAFYPGYAVSQFRDLAELTEAALLVLGLLALSRRQHIVGSAALVLGALARETLLVVPLAGVALWVLRIRRTRDAVPLAVWSAPLAVFAAWSAILATRWGQSGLGQGGPVNFGPPFQGMAVFARGIDFRHVRLSNTDLPELGLVALAVGGVVFVHRWRVLTRVLPLACLLGVVAAACYSAYVWQDNRAFLRALHEVYLAAVLALVPASAWPPRALAVASVPVWVLFAVQHAAAP